jgi:hypothetical protein
VIVALVLACREEPLAVDPDETVGLRFTLAQSTATAGESVAFSLRLERADGSELPVESGALITSDLEIPIAFDDLALTPTLAGMHGLIAAVDGFTDTAYLDVDAGPAARLDLWLAAAQADAGEPVAWTATAADEFGNTIPADRVAVATDSADLYLVPPSVVGSVPGTYVVTATADALSDAEQLRIVPGEPVSLDLAVSDESLELYQTTTASARLVDAYGNVVDADWELSVEGEGEAVIAGRDITFWSEGWWYVYGRYADLVDVVGPLLVDSSGPDLDVYEPDHGEWVDGDAGTVTGRVSDAWSGVYSLTVNGDAVSFSDDGTFATDVTYPFGTSLVEVLATDGDGNATTDTRAVLAGSFVEYGQPDADGLAARINEPGFDVLETIGEDLISGTDISSLIPNPAADQSSESCIDLIFDEVCITWYSVTLYVTNPTIGGTNLEIDPTSGGYLDTTFQVLSPSIDWSADGTVLGIGYSGEGSIYADDITARMELTPYVTDGVLGVTVGTVDVTSSNFTFDWDSWLYDVMSFFGLDLSGLVQSYMEDALESAIADEVPSALADAVGDLEIAQSLDVSGVSLYFVAEPSSATVDDLGMTVGLATTLTTDTWNHTETGLGSLYADYTLPTYSTGTPGMELSVSADFLNQATYAIWGAGILDMEMSGEDLGLDLGEFGSLLGFTSLAITTEALLPPVVVPGEADAMLEFQLGDLLLTLYDAEIAEENVRMQVYVSVFGDMDLDVADGLLSPTLGDLTMTFDVVVPESNTQASRDTEDLLAAIVPMLLPSLTDALGTIPIPDLEGFEFTISSVHADGAENGYITIDGDLAVP